MHEWRSQSPLVGGPLAVERAPSSLPVGGAVQRGAVAAPGTPGSCCPELAFRWGGAKWWECPLFPGALREIAANNLSKKRGGPAELQFLNLFHFFLPVPFFSQDVNQAQTDLGVGRCDLTHPGPKGFDAPGPLWPACICITTVSWASPPPFLIHVAVEPFGIFNKEPFVLCILESANPFPGGGAP